VQSRCRYQTIAIRVRLARGCNSAASSARRRPRVRARARDHQRRQRGADKPGSELGATGHPVHRASSARWRAPSRSVALAGGIPHRRRDAESVAGPPSQGAKLPDAKQTRSRREAQAERVLRDLAKPETSTGFTRNGTRWQTLSRRRALPGSTGSIAASHCLTLAIRTRCESLLDSLFDSSHCEEEDAEGG